MNCPHRNIHLKGSERNRPLARLLGAEPDSDRGRHWVFLSRPAATWQSDVAAIGVTA